MSDYAANVETYDGPCEICGRTPEHEDARRCQLCWSIEEHLASYIETPAGRAFVIRTLGMDRIVGDLSEANRRRRTAFNTRSSISNGCKRRLRRERGKHD